MDYVIKNNKKVYIRVKNGRAETCSENLKGVFSEHKAKNILNSLPKTLRRYHFYVEAIPDIAPKVKENKVYEIPEEVSRWINKDDISPSKLHKNRIQKAVDGLLHRKYTYRITDTEVDENDGM